MNGTAAPEPAEWLSLAAAPVFAAMALAGAAVSMGPASVLCGPESSWPLDGMVVMYLLMCAFHATPWLKRLSDRQAINDRPAEEESECSPR